MERRFASLAGVPWGSFPRLRLQLNPGVVVDGLKFFLFLFTLFPVFSSVFLCLGFFGFSSVFYYFFKNISVCFFFLGV